jgi:hypothetical protein
MANLFWKTPKGVTALLATPFKSEDEFETTVFDTSELLEDIFLLKRQIRGGEKSGIPDIVGIDSRTRPCRRRSTRARLKDDVMHRGESIGSGLHS